MWRYPVHSLYFLPVWQHLTRTSFHDSVSITHCAPILHHLLLPFPSLLFYEVLKYYPIYIRNLQKPDQSSPIALPMTKSRVQLSDLRLNQATPRQMVVLSELPAGNKSQNESIPCPDTVSRVYKHCGRHLFNASSHGLPVWSVPYTAYTVAGHLLLPRWIICTTMWNLGSLFSSYLENHSATWYLRCSLKQLTNPAGNGPCKPTAVCVCVQVHVGNPRCNPEIHR